jgi:hypothetical protein
MKPWDRTTDTEVCLELIEIVTLEEEETCYDSKDKCGSHKVGIIW